MLRNWSRALAATAIAPIGLLLVGSSSFAATHSSAGRVPPARFTVNTILSGASLRHTFTLAGSNAAMSETLSDPDDITTLGGDLFVGFQNGVGPQGQPSTDGNRDSTVVELAENGRPIAKWDLRGKTDGVTADPQLGVVLATVNEDANSSLYAIDPSASAANQILHYAYNERLPHDGGTDAISIYHGQIFISASAPGTTGAPAPQPTYPAVYSVTLDPAARVATVTSLFDDEDPARVVTVDGPDRGRTVALALTDPDSNEDVPPSASRFGGDFMLTSQGDMEQIYVGDAGGPNQTLSVLSLTESVDDTAWPTSTAGELFSTDSTNDNVDVITGVFAPGHALAVATPCDSNSAPATCPAPPAFPANYLASLNQKTGLVKAVTITGASYIPQGGLAFVAASPS